MQADFFLWSKTVLKNSDTGGQCPMALDELLIQHLENSGKIGGWSPQMTLLIVPVYCFIVFSTR